MSKVKSRTQIAKTVPGKLEKREWLTGYLFLLPNFIGFVVLMLAPIFIAAGMSFTMYDGFHTPILTGFKNYAMMFRDDYFRISFRNNMVYMLTTVPSIIVISFFVAVTLNNSILRPLRVMFFFPHITSNTAIAIVWAALFSPHFGPVNVLLSWLGVKYPPLWLASSKWALWAVIITVIWKNIGYYMVLFLAGLQGIPGYLYEAAEMDGASRRKMISLITLPLMTPTIFLCTVMCIINSFQVFDLIFQMTSGGPGRSTNVLVYRVYQEAFKNYNFGYGSAISMFLFVMIFLVTLIQFGIQKKWVYEL
jgi:multiple sugar transport system permease protein